MELVIYLTKSLMSFFIPELLFMALVEKHNNKFKFRFSSIEDYPGLKPFASAWSVGIVAFIIIFLYTPIFELIFNKTIESILYSLDVLSLILFTLFLSSFTLIFIVNYILEKKVNTTTRNVGIISITSLIGFLFSYFHLF